MSEHAARTAFQDLHIFPPSLFAAIQLPANPECLCSKLYAAALRTVVRGELASLRPCMCHSSPAEAAHVACLLLYWLSSCRGAAAA